MILAIDTSIGSTVAVVSPTGDVVAEASSENALGHAEIIGTLLVRALEEAGDPPITHVAAGMGPGPFTGLRIGIAAARAYALGRGIPVIPVPSHDAAALAHLETGAEGSFAIVTDARRRENAVTAYDGRDADGLPRRVSGPALESRETGTMVRDEEDPARDLLASANPPGATRIETAAIRAGDLGRVAALMLAAGRTGDAEPLYLRSPDVTLSAGPKRVTA